MLAGQLQAEGKTANLAVTNGHISTPLHGYNSHTDRSLSVSKDGDFN
ncbi:hypothetical protein [Photobacterium sanctipauli]|nr:hypothetical protein [Photobacterium sanctipauli]